MVSIRLYLKSFLVFFVITSCSESEPDLFSLKNLNNGPDEFSLVTLRAIQMPTDFSILPKPTPGGGNLTDQNPQQDVIVALGGSLTVKTNLIQKDDKLLEETASRFGVMKNIRNELALEDAKFRTENRGLLLERWVNKNVYFKAYASMTLDSNQELERLSKLGVKILAIPPAKTQ